METEAYVTDDINLRPQEPRRTYLRFRTKIEFFSLCKKITKSRGEGNKIKIRSFIRRT